MASDKAIFVRIVRLMNFICAGMMVVDAVSRLFEFQTQSDPFYFLLTFYLIGFAGLLVMAEMRYKKVIIYVEFLDGRFGKGLFVILVGLLTFDEDRKFDEFVGIALTLVGIFNIIVACMRDTMSEENEYEKVPLNSNDHEQVNYQTPNPEINQNQAQNLKTNYGGMAQTNQNDMKFQYKLTQQQQNQQQVQQIPGQQKFQMGQSYQTKRQQ